ncbi:nitric oxide synthase, inducible [Rhineura floridana]|uniref:nitric oxide synthase, inducible n=1 Tax=Rhineura floridana TaxID=261503 RepID=UPI002AC86B09|nr:nitric oxide synthase, inducible [Rhineura floridana]
MQKMMCPCLFTPPTVKNESQPRKDVNNNMDKAAGDIRSLAKQEVAILNHLSKKPGVIMPTVAEKERLLQNGTKQRSGCPRHVKIKNWETGTSLQDVLHHQAKEVLHCRTKVCQGSVMNPKGLVRGPRDGPILRDELLPQAIEFVNLFYNAFKEPKIEEHLARLEAVAEEIETTGTYQLTTEELIFATKQAWRNAPRCIGRIQWSNLQVFDARSCTTAKEMFEHLCRHLEYSTNEGNIRSAITVFPQRTDGKHDFRIWNSQLIRYAGYQMPDGSVVGDPANVEFTQLCMQLGWKPKYGCFDVVPLILQADGQDPELFELPPELILEVPMEHPTYEWFKELDLKWYTVPAVSNMLLEVGGLEFTACPFNGWYVGTEIGVRDFCDAQRYNLLQEVGRRMGLETNKLSSLWKDKAVIEVNVAVLHSFQKRNVTIMDHHSAAESFMKYMQNEYRIRGGCPADWVWLVPPISGSITPLFHQEMLNYILSPFYYYQVEAWKTHVWKDKGRKPRKREIKFRIWVKAVLFASSLMRRATAGRVKATVLYATETGKSETLARNLCDLFNCAFNTKVICMDDYDLRDLEKETLLLVVTSTFGNGDSPSNGKMLQNSLLSMKQLSNKFRYAVFGLGSSMYPEYCAFAHAVYQKLTQLGASPLTPMGEGDELNGQEEAFRMWAVNTFKIACEIFDIRGKNRILVPKAYTCKETWDPKDFRIVYDSQHLDLGKALGDIHGKNVIPTKLKFRQNLQSPKSSRATILIKLSCETNQEVKYLPGDHLGIFPANHKSLVDGIIARITDAPPPDEIIRLETRRDRPYWAADKKFPACTLSQALMHFLDVTTPPSQQLLRTLSQLAKGETENKRLDLLGHNLEVYNKWKFHNSPTILEVLEEFLSVEVSTSFLLSQLPLLKPRYYSISSSQDQEPGELHLTVAVVTYRTRDGKGPVHHGVCSTWLNTLDLSKTILCFVRSADGFRLPKDPSKPCVLIGPGTGMAPFRSFWQQRLYNLETKGIKGRSMILLFGCRNASLDHLYKDEMEAMKRKGILQEVYTAYSREHGYPKVYVQDLLRNELEWEVHRLLHEEDGHLYVCGDVRMAREVAKTLKEMFAKQLDLTEEQAEDYCFQLKRQKRYHEDIFGAVFSHENQRDLEEMKPGRDLSNCRSQPQLEF